MARSRLRWASCASSPWWCSPLNLLIRAKIGPVRFSSGTFLAVRASRCRNQPADRQLQPPQAQIEATVQIDPPEEKELSLEFDLASAR